MTFDPHLEGNQIPRGKGRIRVRHDQDGRSLPPTIPDPPRARGGRGGGGGAFQTEPSILAGGASVWHERKAKAMHVGSNQGRSRRYQGNAQVRTQTFFHGESDFTTGSWRWREDGDGSPLGPSATAIVFSIDRARSSRRIHAFPYRGRVERTIVLQGWRRTVSGGRGEAILVLRDGSRPPPVHTGRG